MQRFKFTLIPLLFLLALSASATVEVTAIFSPARIALGDKAQYLVEIKETSDTSKPDAERVTSLPIPQSGELELSNGRTSNSTQTRIINGAAEYSVTQQLIIDAKAPRVGKFTIPSYVFPYKGETYRVPAATLDVVERPADAGPTTDELIFLKTDTPEQLYVGQTTPIQLKLYISENVRLTGLNSFDRSADGFTISKLPENQESTEIYNGRRYRVLTWPLTITPIQTGEQDLNFQFTVSANLPNQNNRNDPFGGRGFGGSIFDDFFGRSERFTVYNEPTTVNVQALPTVNQPDSFTGAIGDFAIKVYTDRTDTEVGEPIMLSIEISGKGNFDRINGPTIPESDNWRCYDPESKFEPHSENNTLRGTKRFDYVMIPNKSGSLEIPKLEFTYFEPNTKKYTTLDSPPITIKVNPSTTPAAPPVAPVANVPVQIEQQVPLQKELSIEDALLTLDYRPQANKSLSNHPLQSIGFWLINSAIAALVISAALWLRHKRRLKEDPNYAAQKIVKSELKNEIQAAQKAETPQEFYAHAQNAIRLAVTQRSRQNLRTANISELSTAMHTAKLSDDKIQQTQKLFKTADTLRFAGKSTQADVPAAKQELKSILKAI
jgi:hypothetical protein